MSSSSNPQPEKATAQPKKSRRGLYKLVFWLVAFCALTYFLQQQGPISINGIDLTVPVSE